MIHLSKALVCTVWLLNDMAMSMHTNLERISKTNSRLPEIQPSKYCTEGGNFNDMFGTITSTYPDLSVPTTSKRQQLGSRGEEVLCQSQQGGYHSLNPILIDKKPKRLRDGTLVDGADLSLGPPIEIGSSRTMGSMNHLAGTSQGGPGMARKPHPDHNNSHLSSPQGSNLDSHEDTAVDNGTNHRLTGPERIYISALRPDSEPRAARIDIRNFHLHDPDKMCSVAAIHYTQDLIDTLRRRYRSQNEAYKETSWELGELIWTPERLLPFVYFVVSCNPSIKIWEKIKTLTFIFLKGYHKWSVESKDLVHEEKHARFLLWLTEMIYHTTLLGPMVAESNVRLGTPKLSTLARTFLLVNDDVSYKSFMNSGNSRTKLEKHASVTFEEDYKAGYPITRNQEADVSISKNWNKKSREMWYLGKNILWPVMKDLTWDQSKPLLLIDGDIEHDTRIRMDPTPSKFINEFINEWKTDFQKMLLFVKTFRPTHFALPNLSIQTVCKGIDRFLRENFVIRKNNSDLPKPIKFQVTRFVEFLHQDPNDELFKTFWNCYELYVSPMV